MLSTKAFVRQTFRLWCPERKDVVPVPVFRDSVRLNWEQEATSCHPEAYGEYTLNPAAHEVNFSKIPINQFEVIDLPDFVGKPLWQVGAYVARTYASTHLIPGIELWSSLLQNDRWASKILKPPKGDWRAYFLFGSLIRHSYGRWRVPYARWRDARWHRSARWLERVWHAGDRVVLVRLPVAC